MQRETNIDIGREIKELGRASIVAVGNSNGGNKFLNYPKYTKNLDPNAHVHVFKWVIKVNGVTQERT